MNMPIVLPKVIFLMILRGKEAFWSVRFVNLLLKKRDDT